MKVVTLKYRHSFKLQRVLIICVVWILLGIPGFSNTPSTLTDTSSKFQLYNALYTIAEASLGVVWILLGIPGSSNTPETSSNSQLYNALYTIAKASPCMVRIMLGILGFSNTPSTLTETQFPTLQFALYYC